MRRYTKAQMESSREYYRQASKEVEEMPRWKKVASALFLGYWVLGSIVGFVMAIWGGGGLVSTIGTWILATAFLGGPTVVLGGYTGWWLWNGLKASLSKKHTEKLERRLDRSGYRGDRREIGIPTRTTFIGVVLVWGTIIAVALIANM